MTVGPFQPGNKVRIPFEVALNGQAIVILNPRIQRLILPDGTDDINFPQPMIEIKIGIYICEFYVYAIGNYTAILQAELGTSTIERIEPFMVEKPWGFPRIEISSDA